MQASSSNIFHNQINIRICFKSLNQFNNIRMVHLLKKNDFSPYTSLSIDINKLCLIIYFDSIFFAIFSRCCTSYNRICSFANLLSKLVIMNSFLAFMMGISIFIISNLRWVICRILIN